MVTSVHIRSTTLFFLHKEKKLVLLLIRPLCLMSKGGIVGNMMQSVVLDDNPLDEDDGNLLNEVFLDA